MAKSTPKRGNRRSVLLFQVVIVVGLLALVWFGFGRNVLAPQKQAGIPEQLGALELVSSIEGSQALAQISSLHGTDINLVSGYIAEYAHSSERVSVWVGRAESEDAAAELNERMIESIEDGGSAFGNIQRLSIDGHDVFQVDGPGGKHFFYNSWEEREMVVWLITEAADAMPLLEQAINTF